MRRSSGGTRCGGTPVVAILGPTAVGKTAAALELASLLGAEVLSADSRQVYRGMDIGTAKVSAEDRERVPHHLVDLVNPDEPFTLADYLDRAAAVMEEVARRGKIPLVVGGTGLYIRALTEGYAVPRTPPDAEFRALLAEEARLLGTAALHRRLAARDPAAAGKLHPNDFRRVTRALEVHRATGTPISTWQRADAPPRVHKLGLTMDREDLYRRIDARIDDQIRRGLLDEVRALLDRGYPPDLAAFETFGYRELIGHLSGAYPLEKGIALVKRNTRRFAKRQFTWFRREPRVEWLEVTRSSSWRELAHEILKRYRDRERGGV